MLNSSRKSARVEITKQHDIGRIAIELMSSESQIPIASEGVSKRFATRLALFYGTTFGTMGTHLPFFTLWLKSVGIDPSWIGIISAVPAVTRFTVLPFVTGAAGKRYALRTLLTVTAIATAVGFTMIGTQYLPLAVLLAYAATCCMWTPMVPLTDAYALAGVARYGLNYGSLRRWPRWAPCRASGCNRWTGPSRLRPPSMVQATYYAMAGSSPSSLPRR